MTRPISLIVIHCSATPNGRRTTVEDIDAWHYAPPHEFRRQPAWRARQNPDLKAIGYHYVIYPAGTVATGRHVEEIGAHVEGYNTKSIGICMVGTDKFSRAQWDSLRGLVTAEVARVTGRPGPLDRRGGLRPEQAFSVAEANGIQILGHRDLPKVHKVCPGFDVETWDRGGLQPLADHLLEQTP